MSMISAQIDELRELAGDGSMEWVTGPIRASVLRDAADTIWQLRDDLQRTHGLLGKADHEESRAWDRVRKAEAEADRLREERDMYRDLVGMMDHPDLNAQLNAENAKLRELVRDMWDFSCVIPDEPHTFKEELDYSVEVWKRMRELGVEVDG